MSYNPVEIILKKREGKQLTKKEIQFFVEKYLKNEIPEYQMSAFLMAIYFQNMTPEEVYALTEVYINSGEWIKFDNFNTVDKHSTGGVGDKISIPLAPIVAACGVKIPMISGRGLGHTGGTLDKLKSIPGFRTNYSQQEFKQIIKKNGYAIISQSKKLVPADKRIYALRDVTGTVESFPLITASIMSKKIAEGAKNLVMDLKVGTGAFIKNLQQADKLGKLLVETGKRLGQKVKVVFTNMNSPLGHYIGNALEIKESIEYLKGNKIEDIDKITRAIATQMLLLTNVAEDENKARIMINKVISNGKALEKFKKFIELQDGNPKVCDELTLLPQAKYEIPIKSQKSGWIKSIDSQKIGYALIDIDAGRKTLKSKLNYASGAYFPKKIGDKITNGETIGKIYCDNKEKGNIVAAKILNSLELSEKKVEKQKIIHKIT